VALVDLIATGARLIEPDHRLVTGELYPPPKAGGVSLRTFDPEPGSPSDRRFIVASAETIAYAVASGQLGDPRSFKRPVRVTVPRTLPTDDVLILRKGKGKAKDGLEGAKAPPARQPKPAGWSSSETLAVADTMLPPAVPSVMVLHSLDAVRFAARHAAGLGDNLRAVVAEHIPAGMIPLFAGLGVMALTTEHANLAKIADQRSLTLPAADQWHGLEPTKMAAGKIEVSLRWEALDAERKWTVAGTARTAPAVKSKA
jgi:aconitate hydratase